MTELIVALDGPEPFKLLLDLCDAGVTWFKVGPLTLTDPMSVASIQILLPFHESLGFNLFYDAKLADHGPYVCCELAKQLGEKGYAALSTSTDEATEAAVRGAEGSPLKVWRHVAPTSQKQDTIVVAERAIRAVNQQGAHGVICAALHAAKVREYVAADVDIVCPGVRLDEDDGDGHWGPCAAKLVSKAGVTHAVVGRPIWQSPDSVAVVKRYMEALR